MCIDSGPVTTVNGTKIFVMPSRDGRHQRTVYRNAINTSVENVMCLPVPNIGSVKLEKKLPYYHLTSEPSEIPLSSGPSKLLSSALFASSVGEIRTDHADWDHEIFSCFTPLSSHTKRGSHPSPQIHCLARVGDYHPNEDIQLPCIVALPAPVTASSTSWVGL